MTVKIVITKEDIHAMVDMCYEHEKREDLLHCLETIAKIILRAVENSRRSG